MGVTLLAVTSAPRRSRSPSGDCARSAGAGDSRRHLFRRKNAIGGWRLIAFLYVLAPEYRDLIAAYIETNFVAKGLVVYTEVPLGKTIIGKNRKLDIFVLRKSDQRSLALECKY